MATLFSIDNVPLYTIIHCNHQMATNYVYVVYSGNRTYTGYTNNPKRRLRQHNGEICGGAKSTRGIQDWKFLSLTSSDWTKQEAMQKEYIFKHPTGKRRVPCCFRGVTGRLNALQEIWPKVTDQLYMRICPDHMQTVLEFTIPANVEIVSLDMNNLDDKIEPKEVNIC
jgi:predicted GIY-YIG superfamily endonuclease